MQLCGSLLCSVGCITVRQTLVVSPKPAPAQLVGADDVPVQQLSRQLLMLRLVNQEHEGHVPVRVPDRVVRVVLYGALLRC